MAVAKIETTDYLSTAEAAALMDLAVDSVRRYCQNHEDNQNQPDGNHKTPAIAGLQVGRAWLIHRKEVQRYLRERNPTGRPTGK